MTKRKEESLLSILIRKPWYWSVIFSAVLYLLMRYGLPMIPISKDNSFGNWAPLFRNMISVFSKFAPLAWVFLMFIPFSLWHAHRKKRNLEKQSSVDSIKDLTWREFEKFQGQYT